MITDPIRPMLITGSPRSGTTWVGRMVNFSPRVFYISEFFSPEKGKHFGIGRGNFKNWFVYINHENGYLYHQKVKNAIEMKYDFFYKILHVRAFNDLQWILGECGNIAKTYFARGATLFKDPFAIFSAEWLAGIFNMNVLILIRHPAAFVSSMKRMNWKFDFNNFLDQPLLMKNLLNDFESEINDCARGKLDFMTQTAILWKIIYSIVLKYKSDHSDWLFLKHEDISREPIKKFKLIYKNFGLNFSRKITEKIKEYTSEKNPIEAAGNETFFLKRNSKKIYTFGKTD